MSAIASPRIASAREHTRRLGSGNLGYIGALEAAVEDAERQIEEMRRAGDALARSLGGSPGIDVMRSALIGDWREACGL